MGVTFHQLTVSCRQNANVNAIKIFVAQFLIVIHVKVHIKALVILLHLGCNKIFEHLYLLPSHDTVLHKVNAYNKLSRLEAKEVDVEGGLVKGIFMGFIKSKLFEPILMHCETQEMTQVVTQFKHQRWNIFRWRFFISIDIWAPMFRKISNDYRPPHVETKDKFIRTLFIELVEHSIPTCHVAILELKEMIPQLTPTVMDIVDFIREVNTFQADNPILLKVQALWKLNDKVTVGIERKILLGLGAG